MRVYARVGYEAQRKLMWHTIQTIGREKCAGKTAGEDEHMTDRGKAERACTATAYASLVGLQVGVLDM
jgi:TctA family transporter